ncbi:Peptidoglycan/LPS O-acetylase OafA/YrhL, contains acyltransferase and SGNH-hydrolase domains [Chitinophaga sp. CF118]|nr:Peptidoglycan/LPS O-acetylase OafA/YrhL, contains acyltransferase and SGNH-hydrolase domains [Chitinophaga sp. CF118]
MDQAFAFGWTGVDLFFVLSGYLISAQLFSKIAQGKGISLKEFFLKRFFRIIPAYLVVVALYFCIPVFREREALPPLWKFLTFTQNLGLNLKTTGTFSHAWSLCIEEQFYLLLPLIITALLYFKVGRKSAWLIIALFITGFVLRYISWVKLVVPFLEADDSWVAWYRAIYYPTYNRLDGLLVGVSIAGVFQFWPAIRERVTRYGNVILIIGLLLLAGAYFLCEDPGSFNATIFGFPLVAIAYGAIVMAAISPSCVLYRLNSRISSRIAILSYSIYLSHKGVIHLTQLLCSKWGIAEKGHVMFFICMITTILGALVMRYAVEKPFLHIRDYILYKKTTSNIVKPVAFLNVDLINKS